VFEICAIFLFLAVFCKQIDLSYLTVSMCRSMCFESRDQSGIVCIRIVNENKMQTLGLYAKQCYSTNLQSWLPKDVYSFIHMKLLRHGDGRLRRSDRRLCHSDDACVIMTTLAP